MFMLIKRCMILWIAALVALLSGAVFCQVGEFTGISNPYLIVLMGKTDSAKLAGDDVPRSGRWGIWTLAGDPETTADDNLPIIYPCDDGGPGDSLGYTTIYIDGRSVIFGDSTAGSWVLSPVPSDSSSGNYIGKNGFYVLGQYRVTEGKIWCQFKLSIVRDQARFEVTLRNDDTQAHSVGLRHLGDLTVTGWADSNAYPYIPGRGIVKSETLLSGSDIPAYFEVFDDPQNPGVGVRNTITLEDATIPDRVGIGSWINMAADPWDWTPVPFGAVSDYAWALWWDPVTLSPGQTRKIVTYYGVAAASSSWTTSGKEDPWCVAVQGPRALAINYDPSVSPELMLSPNPFKIKAYVYNLSHDIPLSNVSVSLSLPPGLELVSGDAAQVIGLVGKETESAPVEWTVRATGLVSGELTYYVDFAGSPSLSKTVARKIIIPATGTTNFTAGWQMVTIPFNFADPRIESVLGFAPDTYSAYNWNPQTQTYETLTLVTPGKGFWFYSTINRAAASVASAGRPFTGTQSQMIRLYKGWNQIGNPFLYDIPWGRVKVYVDPWTDTMTIEEAYSKGYIKRTVYWFNTATNEYEYSSDRQTLITPWKGYWVKALKDCYLVMPSIEQIGGSVGGNTTSSISVARAVKSIRPTVVSTRTRSAVSSTAGTTWSLRIVAMAGKASDRAALIGVDTRASDGCDDVDVERPPMGKNYVAVSFPHRDWGVASGNYMVDVRRTANTQVWDMEVATDMRNTDVVLTWPNLSSLPRNLEVKLVDMSTGASRFLRNTSSYKYNSGSAGGVRKFRIIVGAAGAVR